MLNLETNETRDLSDMKGEHGARTVLMRKVGEMTGDEERLRWRVVWIGLRGGFEVWRIGANRPLFKVWMDRVEEKDG
jgi:hypothetical protein